MNFIIVQFPIILVSLAYSAGIFISNYSSGIKEVTSLFVSFCFLIVLIVLEKYLKRKDAFKTYFILSSIVVLSFLINSLRISPRNQNYGSLKSEIIITKLFNSNEKYQNCIAKDVSNSRKYLAVIPVADSKYYKVGTKLFVEAETEKLDGLSIPNNFNFTEYLKKKDVHTRMLIHNYTETTDKLTVSRKIEDKVDESSLEDNSKGLMKALVLGRKDGVPDKLMDSFSDSGIMHLLALSGLHIGILTVILTFLLRPLKLFKRGKLIRSLVVVVLLWYYAYITGFSSSIIRATIMFSIIVIGHGM
ncbi:MAG: ComEC/Rec2 family competence protein, partial [Flavobacteriales bacterium]|nr:ComEC/Rec2 family competence protein [Flavobacteriales bacterium]